MNHDQTAFLKSLSIQELLYLIHDIHYSKEEIVEIGEELHNRQWNYVRAVKLGLAMEKGALVATELLWRCYYS